MNCDDNDVWPGRQLKQSPVYVEVLSPAKHFSYGRRITHNSSVPVNTIIGNGLTLKCMCN